MQPNPGVQWTRSAALRSPLTPDVRPRHETLMSFFHRIFGPASPPADAHDAELGSLTWSADLEGWVAATPAPPATFLIAGGRAPDPALLSHARDIARAFPQFQAAVRIFLHQEPRAFRLHWRTRFALLNSSPSTSSGPTAPTTACSTSKVRTKIVSGAQTTSAASPETSGSIHKRGLTPACSGLATLAADARR